MVRHNLPARKRKKKQAKVKSMLGSSWVNGVESVRGEGGLGCAAEVGTVHLQGVTQIWFNWEIMGKIVNICL